MPQVISSFQPQALQTSKQMLLVNNLTLKTEMAIIAVKKRVAALFEKGILRLNSILLKNQYFVKTFQEKIFKI